jgi:hypothetical protein
MQPREKNVWIQKNIIEKIGYFPSLNISFNFAHIEACLVIITINYQLMCIFPMGFGKEESSFVPPLSRTHVSAKVKL